MPRDRERSQRPSTPARPRPRTRREPDRVLARARRPAAVLPPLLPPVADRARARAAVGPGDLRGQPPLVPGSVRDRPDRAPAALLRRQARAVPPPRRGVA